jgi:hypothetical protein
MALNWRGPPKAALRAQLAAAMATYKGPVTHCPPGQAWNEGEHEDDDEPEPLLAGEGHRGPKKASSLRRRP